MPTIGTVIINTRAKIPDLVGLPTLPAPVISSISVISIVARDRPFLQGRTTSSSPSAILTERRWDRRNRHNKR